jgi:uncharacterized membrane protein
MNNVKKSIAVASAFTSAVLLAASGAMAADDEGKPEKCYGVAK